MGRNQSEFSCCSNRDKRTIEFSPRKTSFHFFLRLVDCRLIAGIRKAWKEKARDNQIAHFQGVLIPNLSPNSLVASGPCYEFWPGHQISAPPWSSTDRLHKPGPQILRFPSRCSWAVRRLRFISHVKPEEVQLCGVSVEGGCNPKRQEMEVRKVPRLCLEAHGKSRVTP